MRAISFIAGVTVAMLLSGGASLAQRSTQPKSGTQKPAAAAATSFVPQLASMTSPAAPGSAQPNLVTDSRGRVWLSWMEPRTGGGYRFQAAMMIGSGWSVPITIAEGTSLLANWADFPSLFIASDGTMAAHWLERTPGGRYAYGVRVRTSRDSGRTWSETITPHSDNSPTEHGFVSFFDAPGGGVGLVWLDGRDMAGGHSAAGHAAGMGLRSTIIRNGAAGPEQVVDSKVCDCCQTAAARLGDAVLMVYRDRSDKEIRDTSVARFANGAWSEPVTVHADGWELNSCPVNGPAIATNGNAAAVAWFTGAGGEPKSQVAFSTDGGHTFGAPIRVDTGTTLGRLSMVMPAPDRALVVSLEKGATSGQLMMREIRPNGPVGEPFVIAPATLERSGGFARLVRAGRSLIVARTDVKPGQPSQIVLGSLKLR